HVVVADRRAAGDLLDLHVWTARARGAIYTVTARPCRGRRGPGDADRPAVRLHRRGHAGGRGERRGRELIGGIARRRGEGRAGLKGEQEEDRTHQREDAEGVNARSHLRPRRSRAPSPREAIRCGLPRAHPYRWPRPEPPDANGAVRDGPP